MTIAQNRQTAYYAYCGVAYYYGNAYLGLTETE